jgi:trans-aconitate 2-methyltransferase
MLAAAESYATEDIAFVAGDIASWDGRDFDVVFSNAALHWVPDHTQVLERWREALTEGGQLAVQIPANSDHLSHRVSRELATEWLGTGAPPDPVADNVLLPEQYSELLHALGFGRQHVRLQVYGHLLSSSADIVEWVKGTSLTRFSAVLSGEEFASFVEEYRRRLLVELGDQRPYFYAFKRILMWAS